MVSYLSNTRRRVAFASGLAGIFAAISITFADPGSPVSLSNVDSPDPVVSGSEITYTFTAKNTGGAKVDNVVLTDQLNGVGGIGVPPQFVVTSSRGSCTQTVDLVTCNAGQMEGGGTWVVTVRGKVTAPSGATLNNTASISFQKSAQNFTTTSTSTTLVQGGGGGTELADLSVDKTGPTTVPVNSPMTYSLIVNNTGAANATGVKVVDTLPLGLSNVTHATTSLFVCTNDEAVVVPPTPITVTCEGGLVNAGANGTITINALSPAAAGPITNTASVDPDNTVQENNELNNTSAIVNTSVGAPPPQGPITIVKTDVDVVGPDWTDGAGPDPVVPGATLTYKVLVTNTSAYRADDVRLVDGTQGLAAASMTINQVVTNGAVGTQGGCRVDAPQLTCQIRSLNAGGTVLYTITGQVVAPAGSTLINTGTVSGNIKNVAYSATATELTTVRPSIDLTITKADSPDPVPASSWPTTLQGGSEPPPPFAAPPPMQPWGGKLLAPPVGLGGLKYTITVGNSGILPATGVLVRDQLPGGTIFDHVAGDLAAGCVHTPATNILNCPGQTIPPASTKTLLVYVVAPPFVGNIVNQVWVDPINTIFEADETNNSAVQATTVSTGVDLTLVKDDKGPNSPQGFDPIATAGTQTYIITVDNIGPQSVSNVRVRDVLPAGTTFRSAQGNSGFTCSHANGIVDCVGAYMPGTFEEFYADAGEHKATITIRIFAQNIVGIMHNEARVDPDNQIAEINEQNNIDFEDTEVGTGGGGMGSFNEFSITKTQTKPLPVGQAVARNARVEYDIKVTNDGTDPAFNVVVRDFLPAGARYIEAVDTSGNHFLCSQAGNFIDCVGGELGKRLTPTATATIHLSMFAPDTPGSYTQQAIVDPLNAINEGNEFNNQVNVPLVVNNGGIGAFIDLTIDKTPDNIQVKPKDEITYTLTVKNEGEAPALNVAVRDVLPAGVTFLSAADTTGAPPSAAFTCSEAGLVVTCIGATLDGSANTLSSPDVPDTRTILIKVKAPVFNVPGLGLINQAFVDPENTIPEGNEANNSDTSKITVASAINLRVTKTGPTESSQNQVSQYTITAFNDKPEGATEGQDATGVRITDPLPVGLIPLSVFTEGGTNFQCSVSENPINVVECIGDMPKDDTDGIKITIDVFQTAEGGRKLDNEACIDPADSIEESNENDNCSTATSLGGVQPKISPDLLVTKSVSPSGPVTAGQAVTYTLTISNVGNADAAGELTLTDTLPAHVTFVNFTTTNGWDCTFTAPNLVCHDGDDPDNPGTKEGLDVGASATITIQATYDGGATQPIVNTATANLALVEGGANDTQENEQNQANNTASAKNTVGTTGIDLVVSKIVDLPDPVAIGSKLTYTVIAVNGGTEDSTTSGKEVLVRLDGPVTGVIFASATGSNGFNCGIPNAGGQIECKGDLPAGGDTTLTVEYTVVGGAPPDLQLTAHVDPASEIAETNEGNNSLTEVTTVAGDSCASPAPCIDLVASQLVGTPATYLNNGTVTMSFIVVNTGDASTTLDPTVPANVLIDSKEPLVYFDVTGNHTGATRTVTPTNPASNVTCIDFSNSNAALLSNCYGTLGPGEGVKITVTFTGVTSNSVFAVGTADPKGLMIEFLENNNSLSKTVNKQQ
jgi:uncharacterized repeat protein (TIGR01451 family)